MISALAKAGAFLGEPKYVLAAEAAANFILQNIRDAGGELLHQSIEGEASKMPPLMIIRF